MSALVESLEKITELIVRAIAAQGRGSVASRNPGPAATVPQPTERPLKVYAYDPSAGHLMGNVMTVRLRYEKLEPGPVGEKLAVVDYDGTNKTYYKPVDLDDPNILIQGGLDPTQSDPAFHQQMVYAVVAETLQRFETALGRRIHWSRKVGKGAGSRLLLFPHAMDQANAFYSLEAHGILFGYFRASSTQPGRNLPGQTVFTCLSHDIIVHETTHAIVDSIRGYFTEPTNVDVAAFHEAFADLAALFRHFAHKEALLDTLQKTGGALFPAYLKPEANTQPAAGGEGKPVIQTQIAAANPLIQLAQQFGQAVGMRSGLRSALDTPVNADDINTKTEPHDRGAILVAAVFDAYFSIYTRRTANLFRLFRAGGGRDDPKDLPGPLAEMLAAEASRTANDFFSVCARALDYCPPVDITFGDFLRAVVTAHIDIDPEDAEGIRDAFMEAFRLRGIVAHGATYFSEDSLCWDRADPDVLPPIGRLVFGDPNGLTAREKNINGDVLRAYVAQHAEALGFDPKGTIEVPSFHPAFRIGADGALKMDMVIEAVQTRRKNLDESDPALGTFPLRGGVTLLVSQQPPNQRGIRPPPVVRYVIHKYPTDEREQHQRTHLAALRRSGRKSGRAGAGFSDRDFRINFGLIHGGI
jgi:hypothetical protein